MFKRDEVMMNNPGRDVISELDPDGIIVIEDDGKVGYINPAFSTLTGYSPDEIIGLDEDALSDRLRLLCEEDHDRIAFDIRTIEDATILRLNNPVMRMLSCTSRVIGDAKESPQGRILYFHDITNDLERYEQIKSEFLSVAAHKLRTPLVGILGFSELLLKREFDPAKQKDVFATIFRQASNFKEMLDDFLDIERLDVRRGKDFNIEKGTLENVLKGEIEYANQHSEQIEIILEHAESWPDVNFDADRMKQVFSNLISNAVKYSSEGGIVGCDTVIDQSRGVEEFCVRVIDQGIGISPENLDRIGERFFRVGELQSVSGSGLGIAIVRSIVAIHKGRFEITSIKGKGTTATVWLPVHQD